MSYIAKLSIRAILGLLVGIMGLLLVAQTVGTLTDAAGAWRDADRLSTLTTTSRFLFKTLLATRVERGTEISAVLTESPADGAALARISDNRKISEDGFAECLKRLSSLAIPDLPATLDHLKSAHDAMALLRTKVDPAIQKTKTERDPALAQEVPKVAGAYLDAITATGDLLDASLRLIDPMVDQLLSVKRASWTIRGYGGVIAVRIEGAAASGHSWSQADVVGAAEDAGRVANAWVLINEIGTRTDTPPTIVAAIGNAKQYFVGPMADERKSLIDTLSHNGLITMPMSDLQKRDTVELNIVVDLLNVALDEMIARAGHLGGQATTTLIVSVIQLLAAMVFTVGGLSIVYRRVSLPLVKMTEAMRRLADRDMSVDIPGIGRKDEIGSMAEAVRVFKDNAIRADHLAAEQNDERAEQEKRARTLETLTGEFDRTIQGVLAILWGSATKMETNAQSMSANADQTNAQTGVVAAVEEQSAATAEIARNINQAAVGTQQVSSNIAGVTQAAMETGSAAGQVLSSARSLSEEASSLKTVVDTFLQGVRAA